MALTDRSTKFTGILTLKELEGAVEWDRYEFSARLFNVCNLLQFEVFAFCPHWEDRDEDGKLETPHIHIYFTTPKQIRVGTLINKLAKALDLNTLAITLSVAQSYEGCIQYLIHKNDLNKTRHDISEIVSNINDEELNLALERPVSVFNVDFILMAWKEVRQDITKFIKMVGIERYRQYRYVIRDLLGLR